MVLLETETKASSSSALIRSSKTESSSSSVSFSELLSGVKSEKDDKVVQNGALVLALDEDVQELQPLKQSKQEMLLSLLKNDATPKEELSSLELNPKLTKNLSATELKELVSDAKKYLKTKITESEGFKKSEIESLPKTLKGLAQVAQKFGIDVSKITLESVKPETKSITKVELELKQQQEATPNDEEPQLLKATQKQDVNIKNVQGTIPDTKLKDIKSTFKNEESLKVQASSINESEAEAEILTSTKQKSNINSQQRDSSTKQEIHTKPQNIELKTKQVPSEKTSQMTQPKAEVAKVTDKNLEKNELLVEQSREKNLPVSKNTPIFKTAVTKEITTEQFVQTRLSNVNLTQQNTQKTKTDETLKMLLRGEKVSKQESTSFTADFSVATARVIAPTATTDASRNLESLLKGEQQESTPSTKTEGFSIHKTESLEVKMNEAKQMTKYLSQDVKTAIEDYKSPFTRVKVQLNPERLGSVELTVVQRGKNLHINLSSNNAAINTLAMNANDLKTQLSNNGINNASLNFNNNSQGSEAGFSEQKQGQNSQQGREAQREYNYFDNEEQNEEIMNSLEIVVPHYA